ncbi:MAG: twin-arginine translocation signal domain-containing protein, partial [Pirellulaceae bacterium]|nr:twin-arginine translocation signal domain-containing protein [Pirellulaceae bacterium]
MPDRLLPNPSDNAITRRGFIHATTATTLALTLPRTSTAALRSLDKPVKIGVIADLHHDVMHDG